MYYASGSSLSNCTHWLTESSSYPIEVNTDINLILLIRTQVQRCEATRSLIIHTASEWQSQNLNSGSLIPSFLFKHKKTKWHLHKATSSDPLSNLHRKAMWQIFCLWKIRNQIIISTELLYGLPIKLLRHKTLVVLLNILFTYFLVNGILLVLVMQKIQWADVPQREQNHIILIIYNDTIISYLKWNIKPNISVLFSSQWKKKIPVLQIEFDTGGKE